MATNGNSKLNFLAYHNLLNRIEESKQAPTQNVTSHNSDPVTYRELHYIVNIITNEMNRYERRSSDIMSSTLGAFTQLLIKKGITTEKEVNDIFQELMRNQEQENNNHKEDNTNDKH